MDGSSSPDYKALFLRAEAEREREARLRAQAEERIQPTTFKELITSCHSSFSRNLQVGTPLHSTQGSIPQPTGKFCPTNISPWPACSTQLQETFDIVYAYLQPSGRDAPRLFTSLHEVQGLGQRFSSRKLRSEKDLENYERAAVEDHVHDVIAELCKIPDARDKFQLGDGLIFENHGSHLQAPDPEFDDRDESSTQNPKPDSFCIHRTNGSTHTLISTVEYKPPHKLSVENVRVGLRPMRFWEEIVQSDTIPTDKDEKLRYNAEHLTGSVLAQEYHVMIQHGLEYSYITNGFSFILLYVPYDDPSTLYYYLCEPNMDIASENPGASQLSKTAVARVLCLCLMSSLSADRDHQWRNRVRPQLHIWWSNFDFTRSQISNEELRQVPPGSEYTGSVYSPSEHLPSSPPQLGSQTSTLSQASCTPMDSSFHRDHIESSDSDSEQATHGRKRGFSQVTSSPTQRLSMRPTGDEDYRPSGQRQHTARYCTQKCLSGLQQQGRLDRLCPNVHLHRQGQRSDHHPITTEKLVQSLKEQLDRDLDHNCTPFDTYGAYSVPIKITSVAYGYTVVGKGTTSCLWKQILREAEVYQVLRKAQGSAVPIFLGAIDLKLVFFLHGAGEIRHMLLMGWGGETIRTVETKEGWIPHREISRSKREIRMLGVVHDDLRLDNMLWNKELGRVLIIDFHRSHIDPRPAEKRTRTSKRRPLIDQTGQSKRFRIHQDIPAAEKSSLHNSLNSSG